MLVRPWEEKDIGAIAEMEERCFSDSWTKQDLLGVLKFPFYRSFLAEEKGQVCGYGCLIVMFETAELANIAVDIPYRRQGVSKLLIEAIHETARSLGATECLLEVRVSNAPAISLYEKYGYTRYGIRKNYYGNEDALLMKKIL